jgi:peptide/nickel transport system substrate-binding protein
MTTGRHRPGRRQSQLPVALFLGVMLLFIAAQAGAEGSKRAREGGIFRISIAPQGGLDHIDPALSYSPAGWSLIDTTCARLMAYPDKAPPAGYRAAPEVATALPKVSRDLKTYTFTLRSDFRFSDGTRVRASAFARAINRMLTPSVNSPGRPYARDIVGATEVLSGTRSTARGVVARGNTLVVRFTRPAPDFAARTTLPFFCAVPPPLPADPEGVHVLPGAGPYWISEYRPGERVVIRRNRFYRGRRPHHVDGFEVDLRVASPQEMIQRIDRGEADWGSNLAAVFLEPTLGLVAKYGVNRSRFFLKPGLTLRMFAFNTSRPLFRDNPRLRKAVNFALDRQALQDIGGGPLVGVLTDQYLPQTVPGFKDGRVYPLAVADQRKAQELARGNLRSGKAVLYTSNFPPPLASARLAKQQLATIGLDVDIKAIPYHIAATAYLEKLAVRDEPWDIALVLWTPNIPDPYGYINTLLEGQFIGTTNVARFSSRSYDREMRRVARLLLAAERRRAYGELDVRLARDAAPLAALNVLNEATFVSDRVGCMVLRPALDLTAVCLK